MSIRKLSPGRKPGSRRAAARGGFAAVLLLAACLLGVSAAIAQEVPEPAGPEAPAEPSANGGEQPAEEAGPSAALRDAEARAEAALAEDEAADETEAADDEQFAAPVPAAEINLLELLWRGGYLMLPIAAMSLLVVTFGVERALGLRRHKILPPELVDELGSLAGKKGGLDPRAGYRLCQQYPSAAANVIRAMLLKVGRPHAEVEHAVTEASEREAARLYTNVRWLSLAAGITPLLGLLGTVWGMIQAFFATANLPTGANKAEYLAQGIYVALVTTFAGLAVAIPAAVLAHLFEGRIQRLFRELDEMLLGLMPQLERFEGRLRMGQESFDPAQLAAESAPVTTGGQQPAEANTARTPTAAPK